MKFRHECPDWDYLEIDESDAEFGVCSCELGPEAEEYKEARQMEHAAWNDAHEVYLDDPGS
jgi:hypothetical protein